MHNVLIRSLPLRCRQSIVKRYLTVWGMNLQTSPNIDNRQR
ncbi:hypothetical protein EMIT0158MI4_20619 [Burkholderia ambifaria]